MKKLLLFSAGKESIYCLHKATDVKALLFFNYGQESFAKEYASAIYYSQKFGIELIYRDLKGVMMLPEGIAKGSPGAPSHVPFRNGVFLSIATNIAKSLDFTHIIFGAIKDDLYHDGGCMFSNDFNGIVDDMYGIKIERPCSKLTTDQVAERVMRENMDVSRFWSCNTSQDSHCLKCSKCNGYKEEFESMPRKSKHYRAFMERFYNLK